MLVVTTTSEGSFNLLSKIANTKRMQSIQSWEQTCTSILSVSTTNNGNSNGFRLPCVWLSADLQLFQVWSRMSLYKKAVREEREPPVFLPENGYTVLPEWDAWVANKGRHLELKRKVIHIGGQVRRITLPYLQKTPSLHSNRLGTKSGAAICPR